MITKSAKGERISETLDFVLSTETPDRIGDIVLIDGLDTKSFEENPVALYMHKHEEPIGVWSNLKKENKRLTGTLKLAEKGTSKLVDFAHAMISQNILKAVSVSFIPRDLVANSNKKGYTIKKSELVEVSLVTVPMNKDALRIAKSLGIGAEECLNLFSDDGENAGDIDDRKLAEEKSLRYQAVKQRATQAIINSNRILRKKP